MAQWVKCSLASRKICVKSHGTLVQIQVQRLVPVTPATKGRHKRILGTYCAAALGMAGSRFSRDLFSTHGHKVEKN